MTWYHKVKYNKCQIATLYRKLSLYEVGLHTAADKNESANWLGSPSVAYIVERKIQDWKKSSLFAVDTASAFQTSG